MGRLNAAPLACAALLVLTGCTMLPLSRRIPGEPVVYRRLDDQGSPRQGAGTAGSAAQGTAAINSPGITAGARENLSPLPGAARVENRVSSYSWDPARGWVEIPDVQIVTDDYDAEGRIRSREVRYAGGALLEKTLFSYLPEVAGRITMDRNNEILRTAEVTRAEGRVVESAYAAEGTLLFRNVLTADSAGRVLEAERRDAEDTLVLRSVYSRDAAGNLSEIAYLNPDGSTAFVSSFTYLRFDNHGAWLTRQEDCSFADVRRRPKEVVRRSITATGPTTLSVSSGAAREVAAGGLAALSAGATAALAQRRAADSTPGAKVIASALALMDNGAVVKGGCWDYVDRVYRDAGYPPQKRATVFLTTPEGPYVNVALIRPGDWISFRNLTYGEIGHDALFVDWIDFERRSCLTINYAGENREIPGCYREFDILKCYSVLRPVE